MTPTRREALQGVAALAATRIDAADYDLSNVEEWDTRPGTFAGGEFTAAGGRGSAETGFTSVVFEPEDFDAHTARIHYDETFGVTIDVGHTAEDRDLYLGSLIHFDADTAREFAAAIYEAAEVLDAYEEAHTDE